MSIEVVFDAAPLERRLDRVGKTLRQALIDAFEPVAVAIEADAKARAAAHIRFRGRDPGAYLASIRGGVSTKDPNRVVGYVRSGSPIAHILEYGATVPPHDILPDVAQALAFLGDAGTIFARHVASPGAVLPPYPALGPALDAARGSIAAAIETAARQAAEA